MKSFHDGEALPAHGLRDRPGSAGIMWAASIGSGVAHLGTSTMPFQVGALMDGIGLSASEAGVFAFFEIGMLALSMMLISTVIYKFAAAKVAFSGALLCILAHCAMYYAPASLPLLCLLGAIAGAGYGLVFAAMVSGVAACSNADRIYAIANGGALVIIVGLMAALPLARHLFGPMGAFLGIAIILGITLPAYLGFRGGPRVSPSSTDLPIRQPGVKPLLILWSTFSLGTGAVWSFAERIGHALMLSAETIGLVLSISTFFGILGTIVAAATAGRLSRMKALVIGLVGTGIACLALGTAPNLAVYAMGVLLYWVFYMFLYSYLLGTAAVMDPSGRVGTAGGGCERMGFALGAPIGGVLADHFSFAAVGLLGIVACVALIPTCLPAIRRAFSAA